MDFILGALVGGLALAAAVSVSITYEPYAKITEYRLILDMEHIELEAKIKELEEENNQLREVIAKNSEEEYD